MEASFHCYYRDFRNLKRRITFRGVEDTIALVQEVLYKNAFDTNTEFEMKPILKNGLYCQLAVLMYILSGRLSYYLLETKPDVGLYSTASSLIESVLIITNSITPILLSKIALSGKNLCEHLSGE